MTETMRMILSRVLSTELGYQDYLRDKDKEFGLDTECRDRIQKEIAEFMVQNQIELRDDFIIDGRKGVNSHK